MLYNHIFQYAQNPTDQEEPPLPPQATGCPKNCQEKRPCDRRAIQIRL
jgi:hypothetical protein